MGVRLEENPVLGPARAPGADGELPKAASGEAGGVALPFDLRTVLVGIWRRRVLLLVVLVAAPLLGIAGGNVLGRKTYESETVLLYQPNDWARGTTADAPSLRTSVNMVKIQSNLEEVRNRLKLSCTLSTLANAIEVQVQKETTLLAIRARWSTAQGAADLANTMREVYLASGIRVRRDDAQRQLRDLEGRLQTVRQALEKADSALQKFVADNHIVDLDKELNRYLEEFTSIDILCHQAEVERTSINLQAQNLGRIVGDLKAKVAAEQAGSRNMESLGDLNIRSQRLRESINDDRSRRANLIDLARTQAEFERAERLLAKGAISKAEYDTARANYEKQKAITVDTPEVKAWKSELSRIDRTVLPKSGADTASAPILKEMMLRQFAIQLEQVTVDEKVRHLRSAREAIRTKLDARSGLQRGYLALAREISAREVEKKALEESLGRARRAHEQEGADYTLISKAPMPGQALKSDRKTMTAVMAALVLMIGLGTLVTLELLDPTIKSPAEAALRLHAPVVAALPRVSPSVLGSEFPVDEPVFDALRLMARHLEPQGGGEVVLLASGVPGEGTSFVTSHLAACLARQDKKVLVVDCRVRTRPAAGAPAGLTDLLDHDVLSLDEVVHEGVLPLVHHLATGSRPGSSDRLGSSRMGVLLEEATKAYDVILLDSPPLQNHVEADLLSRWAHRVMVVVKARATRITTLQRLISRLESGGSPVSGLVVNQVDGLYLDRV